MCFNMRRTSTRDYMVDVFEQIKKISQHCVLHTLEQVASLTAEKEIVGVASAKFEKFLQWKQARREFVKPGGTV